MVESLQLTRNRSQMVLAKPSVCKAASTEFREQHIKCIVWSCGCTESSAATVQSHFDLRLNVLFEPCSDWWLLCVQTLGGNGHIQPAHSPVHLAAFRGCLMCPTYQYGERPSGRMAFCMRTAPADKHPALFCSYFERQIKGPGPSAAWAGPP